MKENKAVVTDRRNAKTDCVLPDTVCFCIIVPFHIRDNSARFKSLSDACGGYAAV